MIILFVSLAVALLVLLVLNVMPGEKKIEHRIEPRYGVEDPQFARAMGHLLGPALVPGNQVDTLLNGAEIFPAMLAAIRAATRTICFETYIYWSGEIGEVFSEALVERARAGVRVHVVLDWVGTAKIDERYLQAMEDAGVEVERYRPLRWYHLGRLNNRTHRKLLIVDGRIGFTGGVGIADKWDGHAEDPDHWRDSHFRLEGPAVAQMQAAFLDNWMKTRAEVLHDDPYFPPLEARGPHFAQVFISSPRQGSESVRLMYLLSIASARRRLLIANAYFVPDDLLIQTIVEARARGVQVEVIVPGPNIDTEVTRKASRARWGDLLRAGVEIYEYQPTMYHCKVMIVDDLWVSVGSTNFDNRSFRLNDEANLNILDADFARRQVEDFEDDKRQSQRVTLEAWRNRPLREKLLERVALLVRSQL